MSENNPTSGMGRGMHGTATRAKQSPAKSPAGDADLETAPEITPAPDAVVCGGTSCRNGDKLAKVKNVTPNPRVLCPDCREEFLEKHSNNHHSPIE